MAILLYILRFTVRRPASAGALALTWGNLNLNLGILSVAQNIYRLGGVGYVGKG
jgi:hypothetical protein